MLFLFAGNLLSQTITPQVINSAGSHRINNATGISIDDNVGEPFVQTRGPVGDMMITEGFLQPFIVVPGFTLDIQKDNGTCQDRNDGRIWFNINTTYKKSDYVFTTRWTPAVCPTNNCQRVDSLAPGDYSITAYFTYTNTAGFLKQDSVTASITVFSATEPCDIKIYTGVNPVEGDPTRNWHIYNIDMFPNNKVMIFNRWGAEVFSVNGYINEDPDKSFPKQAKLEKLLPGTYFYIIELGNGTKPFKGWVELVRNY